MCLIRFHKETEEEILPPRVYVRPVSRHSSRRSRPPSSVLVARPITPHRSGTRVSASYLERTSQTSHTSTPRPSQYIVAPSAPTPARNSLPRIIHAPDPPQTTAQPARLSQPPTRCSNEQIIVSGASPRASRNSMQSGRRLSQRESRHGRHGSRGAEEKVLVERSRSRGGERGSSSRYFLAAAAIQKTSEETGAVRFAEGTREVRTSAAAAAATAANVAAPEDVNRSRSRSVTYETNPRVSGRVAERQRVVVEEEDGRRREYYAPRGS